MKPAILLTPLLCLTSLLLATSCESGGGPRAGTFCSEKHPTRCVTLEKKGETLVLTRVDDGKAGKVSTASSCTKNDCHFVFDSKTVSTTALRQDDTVRVGFSVGFVIVAYKHQPTRDIGVKWVPKP